VSERSGFGTTKEFQRRTQEHQTFLREAKLREAAIAAHEQPRAEAKVEDGNILSGLEAQGVNNFGELPVATEPAPPKTDIDLKKLTSSRKGT
jgi:hypothetical protein